MFLYTYFHLYHIEYSMLKNCCWHLSYVTFSIGLSQCCSRSHKLHVILLPKVISTLASPASDSDDGVGNEFEGLDNEGIQTDITVSNSNE